jgi:hypothetical protein
MPDTPNLRPPPGTNSRCARYRLCWRHGTAGSFHWTRCTACLSTLRNRQKGRRTRTLPVTRPFPSRHMSAEKRWIISQRRCHGRRLNWGLMLCRPRSIVRIVLMMTARMIKAPIPPRRNHGPLIQFGPGKSVSHRSDLCARILPSFGQRCRIHGKRCKQQVYECRLAEGLA